MYNCIISFLNKQNFFYKYQYQVGFRKIHSTLHVISLLTKNITDGFENKEQVLGIFLDIFKAFDTIDRRILLAKLWHYGIRPVTNKWLDSYLSNRKQLVEVNGICSDTKIIEFGVSQGSILGPLLFSIYVNDLNKSLISANCIMYADGTNVFLKSNSYEKLYKIDNWLSAN